MVTTETKPRRMSIREFRASLKASMDLPIIVTADGQDAFAVVPVAVFQGMLGEKKPPEAPRWVPPDLARDS